MIDHRATFKGYEEGLKTVMAAVRVARQALEMSQSLGDLTRFAKLESEIEKARHILRVNWFEMEDAYAVVADNQDSFE